MNSTSAMPAAFHSIKGEGRERSLVTFAYLCKQVETAQFADNTVHLRQSLPFTAGLKDTYKVSHQTTHTT